jgi:hypothetical protein
MAKQRTDLTGVSPASPFAGRYDSPFPPQETTDLSTDTSSSLCQKEKERGVGESLAELQ